MLGKPQVRDSSPAERSLSNHEIHSNHMNGNIPEQFNAYPARDHPQISPAGSMASGGPTPMGMLHVGTHSHSSHGSHQSLQHVGYPLRPDQNQNVKNGIIPPSIQGPIGAAAQTASTKHQEQRLTHEQVCVLMKNFFIRNLMIFTIINFFPKTVPETSLIMYYNL